MPRIAIVVITYNGENDIRSFLESLNKIHSPDHQSLIVVDNNSHDGTVVIVKRLAPHAHIIRNPDNRGYATAANQGIRYARATGSDYVFIANQDLVFDKDFLPPLTRAMEDDRTLGAIQPLIMLDPERHRINSCGNALHPAGFGYTRGYRMDRAEYACIKQEVAYCSGAAILLRVSVLDRIGLFDEDFFMYHEDTDLCWRMRIAGYRCMVEPASIVYHHYEFSRSIRKFYYMERNRFLMMIKNYSTSSLFLFTPLILFWEVGMLLYSVLASACGHKTLTFKEKTRAYRYFFSKKLWIPLFAKRTAVQKTRIVPDVTIVSLFDAAIRFQDVDNPLLHIIANPATRCYFFFARQILRLF